MAHFDFVPGFVTLWTPHMAGAMCPLGPLVGHLPPALWRGHPVDNRGYLTIKPTSRPLRILSRAPKH